VVEGGKKIKKLLQRKRLKRRKGFSLLGAIAVMGQETCTGTIKTSLRGRLSY